MTSEERLEKMERELVAVNNRWRLTLLGLVFVVLAVGGLVWNYVQEAWFAQKVICANEFIVQDKNGNLCASLAANMGYPMLTLFDKNIIGASARLSLYDGGAGLFLTGGYGEGKSISLDAGKYGPCLKLYDNKSNIRATLGTNQTTTPDGKTITYPESSLVLFGTDGNVVWQAPR
jgi:hypothetical protein